MRIAHLPRAAVGVAAALSLLGALTACSSPAPEETAAADPGYDISVGAGKSDSFPTIQAALDGAVEGDVILVRDGSYVENLDISTSVTLVADADAAVLQGSVVVDAPDVTIEGLKLNGEAAEQGFIDATGITVKRGPATITGVEVKSFRNWAVDFERDSFGTVSDSYFYNISGGVLARGNSVIENNEIERINLMAKDDGPGDAFRIFGSDTVFRGNYVHGTIESEVRPAHADMIQSWDDTQIPTKNILVEDNVFSGWYQQGLMLENDSFGPTGVYAISDWTVRNNVFSGFTAWGILGGKEGGGGVPNLVVENNVFDGSDEGAYFGVFFVGQGASGVLKNNVIMNVSDGSFGANDGGTIEASNNLIYNARAPRDAGMALLEGDPLFADRSALDYHASSGSPLIDAGTTSAAETDADGKPRTAGASTDIGAYENQN